MYVVRNRARGTYLNFDKSSPPAVVESVNEASRFDDVADLVSAVFNWGKSAARITAYHPQKFDIVKVGPEPVMNYVVVDEL